MKNRKEKKSRGGDEEVRCHGISGWMGKFSGIE